MNENGRESIKNVTKHEEINLPYCCINVATEACQGASIRGVRRRFEDRSVLNGT